MRTITGTYTSVQCFDAEAWKQERLIINFNGAANEQDYVRLWTSASGSASDPLVTYALDANHKCKIDVTDYIRTYLPVSGTIYVGQIIDDGSGVVETITIPFTIKGLINPANVYVPPFDMPDALIVPPERILYAGLTDIICELYPTDNTTVTWSVSGGIWMSAEHRRVSAIQSFDIYHIKPGQTTVSRRSNFYPVQAVNVCDQPAVAVRWVSFTGVQRVHHFMLRKPTIASAGNYQLLTMDNSYNEVKGREDSLDIYLDELMPYDLWYYADVITSSFVEVSLDGTNWNQVQVTNKNITLPTGGAGNGKLEITVNWRRYDAVTM